MLWQPSLPDSYTRMPPGDLARAIEARRRDLGDDLVILGHHYQTDAVIRHADHVGDSLKLSQIAAGLAASRPAGRPLRYVVFCGVHFMAESADMLTPDDVAVILPDLSAGCSMADMAQHDDTVAAWRSIHEALAREGWAGRIVPVTYVNSSAAIKAFVGAHGGSCCTSSNAREVLRWALREAGPEGKVLFLPDQHLGRNTAAKEGIDVVTRSSLYDPRAARRGEALGGASVEQVMGARVILWAGHCSVHKLFRPEHVHAVRERDARDGTRTTVLVHPECAKEVVDLADLDGSTEFIIRTVREAPAGARFAVGTETHLVGRLSREAAERGVEVRILSDCQCLCTTMFRIDEPHLLWALDNLAGKFDGRGGGREGTPRVVNQVRVPAAVRREAVRSLERMLDLAPQGGASVGAAVD